MESQHNFIQDKIGETLLITLYIKYKESINEESDYVDTTACKLVEKIDYDFSKFDGAIKSSVGVIIRTKYFDKCLKNFIKEHTNPIVILLGCGLDTRYQRMDIKTQEKAIFYQLDIPEVIKIREKLIPPTKNERYISSSMFENKWMDKIISENPNGQFIIIIEGVIMYFTEQDLKPFFQQIAQKFPSNTYIYFDTINKWMSKNSHLHDIVRLMDAEFKFGNDDDIIFENWSDKLTLVSTKLFYNFDEWKKTGFFNTKILPLIPQFRRASRLVHYKTK